MGRCAQLSLQRKVEFLSQPDAYPERPRSVERIETHFAWVFLADRFVYKLKKPARFRRMDFTSLESRRRNCDLEVKLNRRLAEAVYIDVVPLSLDDSRMRLEGEGVPVEWLVKMQRLPSHRMLDQVAREGAVSDADLQNLVSKLAAFYRKSDRAPWDGSAYVEHLREELGEYGHRLPGPQVGLPPERFQRFIAAQRRFIDENSLRLQARAADGWVVDAHGDLRPEHICLVEPPQIIDCLEFSRELRLLDSAADLAFLSLECERLGYGALGRRIFELYRENLHDPVEWDVFQFYLSGRASIRVYLSAWRLSEESGKTGERWVRKANWYLDAGQASIDEALG